MRVFGLTLLALAGIVTTTVSVSAGCSVRARYCDYPTWAANAFEGRVGSHYVNNPSIQTQQPAYQNRRVRR